jgi:hypothetical protein
VAHGKHMKTASEERTQDFESRMTSAPNIPEKVDSVIVEETAPITFHREKQESCDLPIPIIEIGRKDGVFILKSRERSKATKNSSEVSRRMVLAAARVP